MFASYEIYHYNVIRDDFVFIYLLNLQFEVQQRKQVWKVLLFYYKNNHIKLQ